MTNLQVLVLVLGPQVIALDYRGLKNYQGLRIFCKQPVMYDDHIKSINSVTATVHEDTVKNVLLTDVRYYLLIYLLVSKPFFAATQFCCPRGKSLFLSSTILAD